ncbi:MAG: carbonic anhydrase [Promethearchaeota archaeon]
MESFLLGRSAARFLPAGGNSPRSGGVGTYNVPKFKAIIITCIDPRVNVYDIFGLSTGDVYVIRSAGNLVSSDVIRSILLVLAKTKIREIFILGHTDCAVRGRNLFSRYYYDDFLGKFPARSKLNKILKEESKAKEYFNIFTSEIENIFMQVKKLQYFKELFDVKVTGLLYNVNTSIIYGFDELQEIRKELANNPSFSLDQFIPARYQVSGEGRGSSDHVKHNQENRGQEGEVNYQAGNPASALKGDDLNIPIAFFENQVDVLRRMIEKSTKIRIKVRVPKIRVPKIR